MKLYDAFEARESCRAYDANRPVEREKLERVLQAACLAPSASNGQPWRYVAVTDPELLSQLAPCTLGPGINQWVTQAPCIIAVWEQSPERMHARYGDLFTQRQWPAMDIGLSVSQLCLAAAAEGLGTCILGWFEDEKAKQLLGIPVEQPLRLLITVGYPTRDAAPRKKNRLPLEETVRFI